MTEERDQLLNSYDQTLELNELLGEFAGWDWSALEWIPGGREPPNHNLDNQPDLDTFRRRVQRIRDMAQEVLSLDE